MYLRETRQKRKDGSLLTHLQVAESVWNSDKKRSETKIVWNCGRIDDLQVVERLKGLAKNILRRCSPEEIVAEHGDWTLVDAWPYGPVHVLEQLWQRLGVADAITSQVGSRKFEFPVERALFAMVANHALAHARS